MKHLFRTLWNSVDTELPFIIRVWIERLLQEYPPSLLAVTKNKEVLCII